MRKVLLCGLFCFTMFMLVFDIHAQSKPSTATDVVLTLGTTTSSIEERSGFVPVDASFIEAIPASDDSVSAVINLPFSVCFFGEQVDSLFINNNGNISLNQPFAANTPLSFPLPPVVDIGLIAPFWSDVDTRLQGTVKFKLSNSSLVVVWEEVSHFDRGDSLTNTFQVVLTDGTDPLLPLGYNLGFFYDEMEWTTGDASGGLNGFQGVPAVAGLNRGNGTDFAEIGRFNQNSFAYDGPAGSNDGVLWLEYRNFYFNTCDSVRIPPIVSGIDLSDTMVACGTDTVDYEITVISQNPNQVLNGSASSALSSFQFNNITSGGVLYTDISFVSSPGTIGTIDFLVFDDANPIRTSLFPIVVEVDTLAPRPTILGDTLACQGDSVMLSLSSTYSSYLWSSGDTTTTIMAPIGMHTVTVSDGFCEESTSHTVLDNSPSISISGREWLCLPDTVVFNATPGLSSYNWSTSPNDTVDSVIITQPGVYFLVASDTNCSALDSIEVKALGVSTFEVIDPATPSCNGDSVLLDAGANFTSYAWSSGGGSQTALLPGGTFTVTVSLTNTTGTTCSDSDTVVINSISVTNPVISGDSLVCNGQASIGLSQSYDSYSWSTGDTTQTTVVNAGGTYSVTVAASGCIADTAITLADVVIPNSNVVGGTFSCSSDSVQLDAGTGWDSVLWNTGDTNRLIDVPAGAYALQAYLNGCVTVDSHVVQVLQNGFELIGDTFICAGETTTLRTDAFFDNYLWSTGSSDDSVIVGPGFYQVIVSLDTCAAASDSVEVIGVGSGFTISGDSIICMGEVENLSVESSFASYAWSNGSTVSSSRISGPGLYSVTATDVNGCVLEDSISVSYVSLPQPVITGDTIFCTSAGTVLSTTLSYVDYFWSTAYTTPTTVAGVGGFTVTVTDTNGCMNAADTFNVQSGEVVAAIMGDSAGCPSGTFNIYTNSLGNILWSTGDTIDSISVSNTGIYSLTVSNSFGCIDSTEYEIATYPLPVVSFEIDPADESSVTIPIQFTDLTTIDAGTLSDWSWSFGEGGSSVSQNPSYTYNADGNYTIRLTVTSDQGCVAFAENPYLIDSKVKSTNIITPNGDGVNDLLVFDKLELFPGSSLHIYNRWGDLVFESDYYQNNWDARFMTEGVYFYVLKLADTDETIQSNFTVIR